jgi:hypothetical protein
MSRLRSVLVSVALVAALAVAGSVRADEVTEDLPWWAKPDYEEQAGEIAAALDPAVVLPEPVDTPIDPTWWAGGPDAVLVFAGGELPSEDVEEEPSEGNASRGDAAVEDDGGRNPLFNRAEGHRAGEDPAGTTGGDGSDPILEEEERDRDGTNECRRLPKQLARYRQQLETAGNRLSPSGRVALEAHIDRLEERQKRRCPESIPPSDFQKNLEMTIRLLAKAAAIAAQVARYMYGSPF